MEHDLDVLVHGLRTDGFVRSSNLDPLAYRGIADALGTVIDETDVRLRPAGRTCLTRPRMIPFHTDHPHAEIIGWHCMRQDPTDGASLLVDAQDALAMLSPEDREELSNVTMPALRWLGGEPDPTPLVDGRSVFFAPWLPVPEPASEVVGRLRVGLDGARVHRCRLRPGEALFVDNRRMLHGRGAISKGSARWLQRLWIAGTPLALS
ncbi:MAG: TauD/TfdA family dioxygenase [Deltaproteobacteria bacterium]|nr:TauD/TfdA family dioxygenase [Deltaproteobacteria bacterium]